MSVRLSLLSVAVASLLAGCAHDEMRSVAGAQITGDETVSIKDEYPVALAPGEMTGPPINVRGDNAETTVQAETVSWREPAILPSEVMGPQAVADADDPYLLDTGDRLRIFIYGQPNLSRMYIVDHEGKIAVPLIGNVTARGKTTSELQGAIRARLGSQFVKDPQVTVDVQQNRPFFIYGEVKTAGQYPYVSGMTIETAIAIAGGFTERASERKFRLTRRVNGFVEEVEAPRDYVVKPGDTVYVFERFF